MRIRMFMIILAIALLFAVLLTSCQAQNTAPTATPTLPQPTSIPPTVALPTSTVTLALDPPVQVKSLEEIVGSWTTMCGVNPTLDPCLWIINADGTYQFWGLGQDNKPKVNFEGGKITISDDVLQILATKGGCLAYDNSPKGYYTAYLSYLNGKPYKLDFKLAGDDICLERARDIKRAWSFVNP